MKFLAFFLSLFFITPTAASSLFEQSVGAWKGQGWVKKKSTGKREFTRCRVTQTHHAKKAELKMQGRCATPGKTFRLVGNWVQENNSLKGRWKNPFGTGAVPVTGKINGQKLEVQFTAKDPETKKPTQYFHIWHISNARLTMSGSIKDPQSGKLIELVNLIFTR